MGLVERLEAIREVAKKKTFAELKESGYCDIMQEISRRLTDVEGVLDMDDPDFKNPPQ